MSGSPFDRLSKRIATRRVSRFTALRGLVAGAIASVTGLSLHAEKAAARKLDRKRWICLRTGASDPGVTMKLNKDEARRHLRKHEFATRGRCTATPTGPTPPSPNPDAHALPTPIATAVWSVGRISVGTAWAIASARTVSSVSTASVGAA